MCRFSSKRSSRKPCPRKRAPIEEVATPCRCCKQVAPGHYIHATIHALKAIRTGLAQRTAHPARNNNVFHALANSSSSQLDAAASMPLQLVQLYLNTTQINISAFSTWGRNAALAGDGGGIACLVSSSNSSLAFQAKANPVDQIGPSTMHELQVASIEQAEILQALVKVGGTESSRRPWNPSSSHTRTKHKKNKFHIGEFGPPNLPQSPQLGQSLHLWFIPRSS